MHLVEIWVAFGLVMALPWIWAYTEQCDRRNRTLLFVVGLVIFVLLGPITLVVSMLTPRDSFMVFTEWLDKKIER